MKTNALWLTAGIDLGLLANLKLTKIVIGIIKAQGYYGIMKNERATE